MRSSRMLGRLFGDNILGEEFLKFFRGLPRSRLQLFLIRIVPIVIIELAQIMFAKKLNRATCLARRRAETDQNFTREIERGIERLPADHLGAEVQQTVGVLAVSRAGENGQVGKTPADQLGCLQRGFDIVDRQHEGLGGLCFRGLENFQARGVAIVDLISEFSNEIDLLLENAI